MQILAARPRRLKIEHRLCGDGFIRGAETCDDGNPFSGDGCSGVLCRQEPGWTCAGQPSVCHRDCGERRPRDA